jgi:hypothetical protein
LKEEEWRRGKGRRWGADVEMRRTREEKNEKEVRRREERRRTEKKRGRVEGEEWTWRWGGQEKRRTRRNEEEERRSSGEDGVDMEMRGTREEKDKEELRRREEE